MSEPLRVLGVRVDPLTMAEAVERVRARLQDGPPGYVVTLNAAMLGRAARDEEFRRAVEEAALVTADGMGTLLAARILGERLPERVAGVDLADRLCAVCAAQGFRLFLFGAAPGVADDAARALAARHPGLAIAGTQHGYDARDDAALADRIRQSRAHLLLVALGAPRQELWLRRWLARTGARAGIGVGGTLDVFAGRARLAPPWMRRMGVEWLYRMLREPRRWRTVAALPGVLARAAAERLRRGVKSRPTDGY